MKNELQKEAIVELIRVKEAETDILKFVRTYLADSQNIFPDVKKLKLPKFHKEIYKLIGTDEKRLGIIAPRGFSKSTIVSVCYPLWLLLTKRNIDILTVSASGTLASEWVGKIRRELETNDLIKNDFNWLKWGENTSSKWTDTHITINDPNGKVITQLRARGRGCQVRGFRPTHVICDDLEDDELVRSSEQRKKLKEWFLGALMNTMTVNQKILVIGTLLHPLSLLAEISKKKGIFKKWKIKMYKAITDGKSIWQAKWPLYKLRKRKKEIGTYKFEAEFQNNPMASTDQLIRPEWILRYNSLPPKVKKRMYTIAALDPAISTSEEADEAAIVVLGYDEKDHRIFELESRVGKWGLWRMVDEVFAINRKHSPTKFIIEQVAFQQVLKPVLKKEEAKRNIFLPIKMITMGTYSDTEKERRQPRDKFTRALGITHLFENKNVFLRDEKLIEQCIMFPTGDKDDLFDALVYGLHGVMKHLKGTSIFRDESERITIKKANTFEVQEEKKMPCLAPPPGEYKPKKDWRL